jgi:hypothetical protein
MLFIPNAYLLSTKTTVSRQTNLKKAKTQPNEANVRLRH